MRSGSMAPWSSLTSCHSPLARWSYLLPPFMFLMILAPHNSRPHGIDDFDFGCWDHYGWDIEPKGDVTIIYPYNLRNNPKGDVKSKIGSQHEVYCRFNSSIYNADDIYFETRNRCKVFTERLPHKIVNDSTIMAMLPSDYPCKGSIACKNEQDQLLCYRDLIIGYEPQDVENFTCISDNWETLNCTWDVPNNPLKVEYTMTYAGSRCLERGKNINIMTWSSGQRASILLNPDTKPVRFVLVYDHYDFCLSSQNLLGIHTQNLSVSIYEIVRPGPFEFKTTVMGPYSVTIEWELPYPFCVFPGNVRYEISTRLSSSENDNDHHANNKWTVLVKELITIDPLNYEDLQIDSVPLKFEYANTDYEIRMRLHTGTGTIREHMWSIPMIKVIRTLSTKPIVAPKTIQGMFEVHNSLKKRDILVYWQKIDPMLKNGDEFKYIVEAYGESDKKVIEKHEVTSFVKFENLKLYDNYRFVITSSNENGTAGNHSEVCVPSKVAVQNNSKTFNVIAHEAQPEGTVHTVSLSFEDGEQVQSITIFWCKKSGYDYRCNNKMEWLTINWSDMFTKEKNLTLENGTHYAFGRAVTSNNESSGIIWIKYVASSRNEPPKVDRLDVFELSATSVTLTWEMVCGDKAAIPIGAIIPYCELPKTDIEQNNQEDACKDEHSLLWRQVVLIILGVICGMALRWIGDQLYRQGKTFCEHYRKYLTNTIPLPNAEKPALEILPNSHNHYQKGPSQLTPINKDNYIDRISEVVTIRV